MVSNLGITKIEKRKQLLEYLDGEVFKASELTGDDAMGFIHLPLLGPINFLSDSNNVKGVVIQGFENLVFGQQPEKVAEKLNTKTIRGTTNIEVDEYVKMLAKIGYGYAVSQLGTYDLSEVPVLPMIMGTADPSTQYVGSALFTLNIEAKGPQHALGLHTLVLKGEEITVALIKLYANTGVTGYGVVVRKRPILLGEAQ